MKIDSPKDLEKVIAVMRKTGVESLKIGDIEIRLGDMPERPQKRSKAQPSPLNGDAYGMMANIPIIPQTAPPIDVESFDSLSDEERLFYSVSEQQ